MLNPSTGNGAESSRLPLEAVILVVTVNVIVEIALGRRTMPGKKKSSSIKNPKTYEGLKKKGMPKSRAAAISNAQAKKKKKKK